MRLFLPFLFAVLLPLMLVLTAAAQAPAVQWERTLGGSGEDGLNDGPFVFRRSAYDGYVGVRAHPATGGGYWVGAESASSVGGERTVPQRGAVDYWLLKLNNAGRPRWDRAFGGLATPPGPNTPNGSPATNHFYDLCPTADGGVLLAGTSDANANGDKTQPSRGSSDYWLVKLDSLGVKQWDTTLGGPGAEFAPLVRQTPDGGYLVAGSSASQTGGDKTQPSTGSNFWVVRLSSAGAKLWDVAVGSNGYDTPTSLLLTPDGGCIVAGSSRMQGTGGTRTAPDRGGFDFWLVKLDATGNQQWDRAVGSPGNDNLYDACLTPDGGILLAGCSDGGVGGDKTLPLIGAVDAWLVKFNAAGAVAWQRAFGQAAPVPPPPTNPLYYYYYATKVLPNPNGGYLVFGGRARPLAYYVAYWLQPLDDQGNPGLAGPYQGGGYDLPGAATFTPDGGLLLTGTNDCPPGVTSTTATGAPVICPAGSDDKSQPNRGGTDLWLVKTAPLTPTPARPAAPAAALRAWPVPAPAGAPVRVALPAPAPPGAVLALRDLAGRLLARCPLAPGAAQADLPTAGLAPGAYLLQLLAPDARLLATQRLLLE